MSAIERDRWRAAARARGKVASSSHLEVERVVERVGLRELRARRREVERDLVLEVGDAHPVALAVALLPNLDAHLTRREPR